MRFEIYWDWCQSDLHGGERRPSTCVSVGSISICEHCLLEYVNGWDNALGELFVVREHANDLVGAVACATRLVLGLEDA